MNRNFFWGWGDGFLGRVTMTCWLFRMDLRVVNHKTFLKYFLTNRIVCRNQSASFFVSFEKSKNSFSFFLLTKGWKVGGGDSLAWDASAAADRDEGGGGAPPPLGNKTYRINYKSYCIDFLSLFDFIYEIIIHGSTTSSIVSYEKRRLKY